MQDFEKHRYERALDAFAEAFAKGYADGKRLLAAGDLTRPALRFPFSLDVPRDRVLDGEWTGYVQQFEQAGIQSALSLLREGEAHLDPSEAYDNSPSAFLDNTYRWYVVDRRD